MQVQHQSAQSLSNTGILPSTGLIAGATRDYPTEWACCSATPPALRRSLILLTPSVHMRLAMLPLCYRLFTRRSRVFLILSVVWIILPTR